MILQCFVKLVDIGVGSFCVAGAIRKDNNVFGHIDSCAVCEPWWTGYMIIQAKPGCLVVSPAISMTYH